MKISFGQMLVILTILGGIGILGVLVINKSNDIEAKYREVVDVFAIAKDLGLNIDQFKKDIDSKEVKDKVANDKAEATTRLNGSVYTPSIFIEGTEYKLQTLGDLETKLDATVTDSDHPVLVEEFFDFNCPHCYEFEPYALQVQEKFGDKINFEMRYLPFLRPSSDTYAQAAEAAKKQGKYSEFTAILFSKIHGDGTGTVSSPIN
ncbi:MAG: thioredoxin domain-containing protein [Candidatus Dojkabacteria bacterium]